ncbi:MAG: hypothetical protein ACYC2O_10115 [Microthrixaceae bacterium]
MLLVTALVSLVLVTATTGTSSAAPVSAVIPVTCRGLDAETNNTLALAKGLIGSDTVTINLNVSAADIPETAGLDQEINAVFNWTATMDQNLVDQAAGLIPSITVKNIEAEQLVKGPSDGSSFSTVVPGPITIAPAVGVASVLDIGPLGGTITTNGGGIVTYRVGAVKMNISLSVPGAGDFNLNLGCAPDGTNLIAKTSVKDPDAPTFTPEVIPLTTNTGGTTTVDLLNGVITPGKTPLLPETLEIVEQPAAGTATITNGVFSFTAPGQGGTYSATVQICGAPKTDSGTAGISEVQTLTLGDNWTGVGTGGGLPIVGQALNPRPIAFTLKVGDQETPLIWAAEHVLLPGIVPVPLPNGAGGSLIPTPENWAPIDRPGLVNQYATDTKYRGISAVEVQAALESLPNVGIGNVEVVALKEGPNPAVTTGFQVNYIGALAEQDVPSVSLGQWYSVPPQEVLDRISAAISELASGLGGDDGVPPSAYEDFLSTLDPNNGFDQVKADNRLVELLVAGTTAEGDFSAWLMFKLNIGALVPQVSAFLNGLFPQKIATATATQGEAPTPPQPLCAQGIIDVTVTEVAGASVTAADVAVAGSSAERGIGFVG